MSEPTSGNQLSLDVTDALAVDAKLAQLGQIFRPASPTEDRSMFKGRTEELRLVTNTLTQPGQHVVIYGERGVGKTSLSYMAREIFRVANAGMALVVRLGCSNDDSFETVWKKLTPRLRAEVDSKDDPAVIEELTRVIDKYEDLIELGDAVTAELVARALDHLSRRIPLVVILDEFDRIGDWDSTVGFADLIKTLSDDLTKCTLVIVGVADDVDGLIRGHRSIDRALKQVHMPRMTRTELEEVVEAGFRKFANRSGHIVTFTDHSETAIVRMSHGLPYYTHLLSWSVGEYAITNDLHTIGGTEVVGALITAVKHTTQSIKVSYTNAVSSNNSTASFDLTLLACAMAQTDAMGFFSASRVAEALSSVMGKPRTSAHFKTHLERFTDGFDSILESRPFGQRVRYRFRDPLMRPFVLIRGLTEGKLVPPPDDTDDLTDE